MKKNYLLACVMVTNTQLNMHGSDEKPMIFGQIQ